MKVILNYNPTSGAISDKEGLVVATWIGLIFEAVAEKPTLPSSSGESIDKVVRLAGAGFDVDAIAKLASQGLL